MFWLIYAFDFDKIEIILEMKFLSIKRYRIFISTTPDLFHCTLSNVYRSSYSQYGPWVTIMKLNSMRSLWTFNSESSKPVSNEMCRFTQLHQYKERHEHSNDLWMTRGLKKKQVKIHQLSTFENALDAISSKFDTRRFKSNVKWKIILHQLDIKLKFIQIQIFWN